jgi:putative peptide zinc metalloprotease protein
MSSEENTPQQASLPKLRKGITCTFGDYDIHGKPHWMINDPGRNKFFIIGWAEYQIFEHWDVGDADQIIEVINNKTTLNLNREDIESFYNFLKKNYLIQQSGYDIHTLGKEQKLFAKDNWLSWLIDHYLFFRIPLWHPDKFLIRTSYIASFLFSRNLFYIMIMLAFFAVYQISMRWDMFTHTFSSIFNLNGLIFYFIAFSFCKFCHEMGHAYMCRRYDVPVQSLGLAFLVFWPVLYTDTTLSWVLKSHQRMKIALAGIWIETYVTIIAALIWCNTSEITIKTICYMIISVNWMASLLINVSPFMRFDGYYVLADFMKMPNLQPRAFALTRWQLRQWLFGWQDPPPETYATNMRRFLIAYSIATWLYRLTLYLGIAVLVYHFFIKIVGIVLFAIEVYYFILAPFVHEVQAWIYLKDRFSWNNRTAISASTAIILVLLFFLPIRTTITLPGTLSYFHEFVIAQEEGMVDIDGPTPKAGATVKKGEIILELTSVDLENALNLVMLRYEKKLMELRNAKINLSDFNQKNVILSDLNKSQAEYSKLYSLYDKLKLRAPFDGVLYEVSPDLEPGVFIKKNEWVADVVDTSREIVEAYINEADLYRIKVGLTGYFYPSQFSETRVPIKLISIDTLNTNQLNCQYSKTIKQNKEQNSIVDTPCYNASEVGGGVATYITDAGTYVPVKSVYRVKLAPDYPIKINYVERGSVVVNSESTSFAAQLFYWVKSVLVEQSGF